MASKRARTGSGGSGEEDRSAPTGASSGSTDGGGGTSSGGGSSEPVDPGSDEPVDPEPRVVAVRHESRAVPCDCCGELFRDVRIWEVPKLGKPRIRIAEEHGERWLRSWRREARTLARVREDGGGEGGEGPPAGSAR